MDRPTPTKPLSPPGRGGRGRVERGRRIVKRIVGPPGERVRLDGGQVWIDGRPLAEPNATAATYRGAFDVPRGHYLLLGDERAASSDSRSWNHPYVARAEIVGVLLTRRRRRNDRRYPG